MACSGCARRRQKLQALKEKKRLKWANLQAAAIGAVLTVTDVIGSALGTQGKAQGTDGQAQDPEQADSKPASPAGLNG